MFCKTRLADGEDSSKTKGGRWTKRKNSGNSGSSSSSSPSSSSQAVNARLGWRLWHCVDDTEVRPLQLALLTASGLYPRLGLAPAGHCFLADDTIDTCVEESEGGQEMSALLRQQQARLSTMVNQSESNRRWAYLCPLLEVRTHGEFFFFY